MRNEWRKQFSLTLSSTLPNEDMHIQRAFNLFFICWCYACGFALGVFQSGIFDFYIPATTYLKSFRYYRVK